VPNPAAAAVDVHNACVERAESCMRDSVAAFGAARLERVIAIKNWRSFALSAE
jgi:hypothetical protein